MKFTTLLTKTTALAFILAAGITHSMAAEVDCTAAYVGDEDTKPSPAALKCVNNADNILLNAGFAETFRETHCTKKTSAMLGGFTGGNAKADWKSKNTKIATQAVCENIGAALDCKVIWGECADDKDCEKKAKTKGPCREPKAMAAVKKAAAAAAAG